MVPTLTPVSRQAIFAGALPGSFAQSVDKTDRDAQHWRRFWTEQGENVSGVRYERTRGGSPFDVPQLGDTEIMGLVVTAVDKMLHGADVLGDAQVSSAVKTWADHGFLAALLESAGEHGYEVWVTSDHGNIEARPLGRKQEGAEVEAAGVRVRWYGDPALRDGSRLDGIVWDPPGLGSAKCYPLFPEGRGGFFSGDWRVTHGGISIDEVIVPFARIEAT